MEKRCCALRDRLRWWGIVIMLGGAMVLCAALPVGLGGVIIGISAIGTVIGYILSAAALLMVSGAIAALSYRIPRAFGRRAKCPDCTADGTPDQYNPFRRRDNNADRTDPDESGVRSRPDSPQEPTASKETK